MQLYPIRSLADDRHMEETERYFAHLRFPLGEVLGWSCDLLDSWSKGLIAA